MITIHKCLRCGHEWPSRLERLPKQCPKCRSPYWNKPKVKQSGPKRGKNERIGTDRVTPLARGCYFDQRIV